MLLVDDNNGVHRRGDNACQPFLAFSKLLFASLAFSNVHRYAKHPLGATVYGVIESSVSCDPPHGSVRTHDAEFRYVWLMISYGVGNRFPDKLSVFRMYAAAKLLDALGMGVRWNSEHSLEVTKPTILTAPDVPIPSHRLPGRHGQTKPLVGNGEFGFHFSPSRSLPQQSENQQRLHQDQRNARQ